jgi:hypothetical protein
LIVDSQLCVQNVTGINQADLKNRLLDIYLNVTEDDIDKELDGQLKISLRNAVTYHVIPQVKFLINEMTNVLRGTLDKRNQLSSFPSFWMPDFSDPSDNGRVAHFIVDRYGMGNASLVDKARFGVGIRDKVKPIINNYRSNTANTFKKNYKVSIWNINFAYYVFSFLTIIFIWHYSSSETWRQRTQWWIWWANSRQSTL